jgi:hypothetical protein
MPKSDGPQTDALTPAVVAPPQLSQRLTCFDELEDVLPVECRRAAAVPEPSIREPRGAEPPGFSQGSLPPADRCPRTRRRKRGHRLRGSVSPAANLRLDAWTPGPPEARIEYTHNDAPERATPASERAPNRRSVCRAPRAHMCRSGAPGGAHLMAFGTCVLCALSSADRQICSGRSRHR